MIFIQKFKIKNNPSLLQKLRFLPMFTDAHIDYSNSVHRKSNDQTGGFFNFHLIRSLYNIQCIIYIVY